MIDPLTARETTEMDLIVEMRFGSHLYGTNGPDSDLDFKAVYIPEARDILLQRVRGSVSQKTDHGFGRKNAPGEEDREAYSLDRYLSLLAGGQTVALDMLFAPEAMMMRPPAPLWRTIVAHRDRLVTRKAMGFVRYCEQQANKYGIKGSRVASARAGCRLLAGLETQYGGAAKLGDAEAELVAFCAVTDHAAMRAAARPGGIVQPGSMMQPVRHLVLCGKAMPLTSSIKNARQIAERMLDAYGDRARQAAGEAGVDWKALSHAVRVGSQALELFQTGRIVFPLVNAAEILAIKRGQQSYEAVAAEIERLLAAIETASERSCLRAEPDYDLIDDLVLEAYRAKILSA